MHEIINKGGMNKIHIVTEQDRTHVNGLKLDQFRFNKGFGRKLFTNTLVNEWNRLNSHVISANMI